MKGLNKITLPNGNQAIMAEYKEQVIKEYKNNPLIEALPEILSKYEVMDKLAVYPYYEEKERLLEPQYRYHLVQRLFNYFQPLNIHIQLESIISRVIRQGYSRRNVLSPNYANSLNEGYQMILDGELNVNYNDDTNTTASGFAIVGASGIGKTTAINRILSTMPQVIFHNTYKERKLNMYQVLFLKIDCPFDGSIRGLCIDFFSKIDKLIGTNYYKKYATGRISSNVMLPVIAQIARNCNLAILIVDEIQHLSLAKSGGAEKMLNFFVTLSNIINLPVITIGTSKAMSVLQSEFRQARRSCGQGNVIFERMKKDSNWQLLIEGMFGYQWTRKVTPLTNEINDVLYEESQGITDIAVKLYAMAQIKAISNGKEEITSNLIKQVAKDNFQLIKPMMDALKSGNNLRIAKFEDIASINIDEFLNKEISNINLNNKLKELQSLQKNRVTVNNEEFKEQAIVKLLELDVEPNKAKKCVEKVLETSNFNIKINEIVKEAYKLTFENVNKNLDKSKKSRKIDIKNEHDLRFIINKGKENNISAYEALKANGYIKEVDNDFFEVG